MENLKQTSLYEFHNKNGGKIVAFGGWEMPLNYPKGIKNEHIHTRQNTSLFDVSHMGQLRIVGENAEIFLEKITPTDITSIKEGHIRYSLFLNKDGGIIDDLMIYRLNNELNLVVNAGRLNYDLDFLNNNLIKNVKIIHNQGHSLIALQGPKSREILERQGVDLSSLDFMKVKEIQINNIKCIICCCGYTGEDGFEISIPSIFTKKIVEILLDNKEVCLAGLGARDTLRIEAGLPLWGNEISEKTNPIEANLNFSISKKRLYKLDFPGAKTIYNDIKNGPKKIITGLLPLDKRPLRSGTKLFFDNAEVGHITSGSYSPSLEKPISIGYVKTKLIKQKNILTSSVGGRNYDLKIVSLPFLRHNYFRR